MLERSSLDEEVEDVDATANPATSLALKKAIAAMLVHPLAEDYREEVSMLTSMLETWSEDWTHPGWRSFLNKSSFLHEVEEVVVPLHCLLRYLAGRGSAECPLFLVDLCAGKGFFSFCVLELASRVPLLRQLGGVVVLDQLSSSDAQGESGGSPADGDVHITWEHFTLRAQSRLEDDSLSLQLWDGVNLHDAELPARLARLGPVLLSGTHLCRRLSSRAVELFNVLPDARLLVLAPCCIPPYKKRSDLAVVQRSPQLTAAIGGGCTCGFTAAGHRVKRRCKVCWASGCKDECWRCGERGHSKNECESKFMSPCLAKIISLESLWAGAAPFDSWVEALRDACAVPSRRIDAELRSEEQRQHDTGLALANPKNKTMGRRMSWIVAEASAASGSAPAVPVA